MQELSFKHLKKLTTNIGIYQHCINSKPNLEHGYSIDDVARALIICIKYYQKGIEKEWCQQSIKTHFNFIKNAQLPNGKFHNFADDKGNFLDSVGSDDSFSRTMWALGELRNSNILNWQEVWEVRNKSFYNVDSLQDTRSLAFCSLGNKEYQDGSYRLAYEYYTKNRDTFWHWFEPMMTYENARLPQALLYSAEHDSDWNVPMFYIGRESLDFLIRTMQYGYYHSTKDNIYNPIGNEKMDYGNWFQKGDKEPPLFDQQPVDTGALVESCVQAHTTSLVYEENYSGHYLKIAKEVYEWYFGKNIHNISVYNEETGGVHDALTKSGVNINQGAESILSIHLAKLALEQYE